MQLQITLGEAGFLPDNLVRVNILFYKKNKTQVVLAWHQDGVITFYPSLLAMKKDKYLYNYSEYSDSLDRYFRGFPKTIKDFCSAILRGEQTLDNIVTMEVKI